MNEAMRHDIVQRHQQGASIRAIAKELGISRGAVGRALTQVQAQRDGPSAPWPRPRRRGSILDAYQPILQELLGRYPDLTVERALQELQAREQDLRNQNILFNAALTNMSQGLVMFDAQGRVIICNQRYLDMYGLTPAQAHPGSLLVEVLRHRLASGSFGGDPEVYAKEILGRIPDTRTSKRIVD